MHQHKPWTELYRPQSIDEMVLAPETLAQIKTQMNPGNRAPLLIQGKPGVGKTTTARCLARAALGDGYQRGYLEVNAADDRGAEVVGGMLIPFCRRSMTGVPMKIVFLDEADNLTEKCQLELAEIIRKYRDPANATDRVRFILACNETVNVVESLQSLCRIIYYSPLDCDGSVEYLEKICHREGLDYTTKALRLIYRIGYGDMRKCINNLEKISYAYRSVTRKVVLEVCHFPDPEEIGVIITHALAGRLDEACRATQELLAAGHYYTDIISSTDHYLADAPIDDYDRMAFYDLLYRLRIDLQDESGFPVQFYATVCQMVAHGMARES